jgi:Undecaprenyl-phosphate glucose phosphotransferase
MSLSFDRKLELSASEPSLASRLPHQLSFNFIEPLVLAGDFFIVFAFSIIGGVGYQWIFLGGVGTIQTYLAIGVLVYANFAALLKAQQNYRVVNLINCARQIRYVTCTWWLVCFLLLGAAFSLKIGDEFSRGSTLAFFAFGWMSLLIFRTVIARKLTIALEKGTFAEKKVILITEQGQQGASRALADLRKCGYVPVEIIEFTPSEIDSIGVSRPIQQKMERIISVSRAEVIDHVLLLIKWSRPQFIENLVRLLRVVPIPINLLPDQNVSRLLTSHAVNVGTSWTVELQRIPLTNVEQAFKRGLDIIGACIAIVLLSPLMLVVALSIKLDSSGPIFFTQRRNGFSSSTFRIYKFRTMRVLEDGDTIPQATRGDPRVTRFGRMLRQTSIDELPQLFNVLAGNMSLVGPRPHAVAHNSEYQKLISNYAFRHHVKPGITGWAQVNGYRGESQTTDVMAERVEYDLWYINHWSLWLDLKILLKTVISVYHQPTAY